MIDLQAGGHVAAGDDAVRVPFDECRLQWSGNRSTQMADGGHIDAVGDDKVGDGIAHQVPGDLDGDRSDAGNLTALSVTHAPPPEGLEINPQVDGGLGLEDMAVGAGVVIGPVAGSASPLP